MSGVSCAWTHVCPGSSLWDAALPSQAPVKVSLRKDCRDILPQALVPHLWRWCGAFQALEDLRQGSKAPACFFPLPGPSEPSLGQIRG